MGRGPSLYTAALAMDPHLVEAMISTLLTTPHRAHLLTQTLAILTAYQKGTAMEAPSHDHSWPEVIISDQPKLKFSMKLPKYRIPRTDC